MRLVPSPLRATLAAWGLAFLARALLGCEAPVAGQTGELSNELGYNQGPTATAKPSATASASASEGSRPRKARRAGSASVSASAAPSESAPAPPAEDVVTISAVGDCTLGDPAGAERAPGAFHRVVAEKGGDLAYPFSGVRDVLAQDDLTIANLEGTLTTAPGRNDLPFSFRGKPEFAGMLPLGSVELVALANNHAHDCGPRGERDTIAALEAAKVGYFGLGHVDKRTIKGIEIVNLGWTGGRPDIIREVARAVREHKRPDNVVIVSFHWGIEEEHAVNGVQLTLGRGAIVAGADLVLGHHPHVLQGIEVVDGKPIVYSLGNFVFGGNAQPDDIDSMIFRARFAKRDGVAKIVDHEIIPVQITGVRAQNDFRPVLLEGAEAERVKADVARYGAKLGG